jgi:DNA-binding NarL/FixJ family response regulator
MANPEKTVLVVDDNQHIRAGIRRWLEHCTQLTVCGEASDGTEAVQEAVKERPSLILMDLSMPEMNGIEAASIIRHLMPDTRIVLFTLFAEWIGHSLAKSTGVDLIIPKTEGTPGLLKALAILLTDSASNTPAH